jgi:hypothetical protein
MATPYVAGAAALVLAVDPGASHLGLKALLLGTVDTNSELDPGAATPVASGGRLNVNSALRCRATPMPWLEAPTAGFVASIGEPVSVRAIATNCADPTSVAVSVLGNGIEVSLASRGDGLYTGSFTPAVAGPIALSVVASVGQATRTRTVEGAAVANYVSEDAPFDWVDATLGTEAELNCDDCSLELELPFAFSFYGQAFTNVRVSSNGYVVFGPGSATSYVNAALPNASVPNGIVAPFWDDLDPSTAGGVWFRTVGAPPDRRFVVAWVGVPHYGAAAEATFEVVFEERTHQIYLEYRDVDLGEPTYNGGASATVGVENLEGTVGKQLSYNQVSLTPYENAKAIRLTYSMGLSAIELSRGVVG